MIGNAGNSSSDQEQAHDGYCQEELERISLCMTVIILRFQAPSDSTKACTYRLLFRLVRATQTLIELRTPTRYDRAQYSIDPARGLNSRHELCRTIELKPRTQEVNYNIDLSVLSMILS
jgi:hypothetical protein